MVEAPTNSLTTLYIIQYLAWHREGHHTFDRQRVELLDRLARIIADLKTSDQRWVLPGGETIILSDVGMVNQALLKTIEIYIQQGRLAIGPWYIQLDGLLASGEAYVRSLLLGQQDASTHNITLNTVALLPENYQGSVQLPQILKHFGIQAIFAQSTRPMMPLPFNWQSDDGSQILVIPYQAQDTIHQAIEQQKKFHPDGPFLWVQDSDTPGRDAAVNGINQSQTSLADFVDAVRNLLPDDFRPVLADVLYLQPLSMQSGRFSARVSLKQEIIRLNGLLTHHAEALLGLSLVFGHVTFPDVQKSLLDYSWRMLLQNMSPKAFAGAVSDDTYDEMQLRNRRVADNAQQLIEKAVTNLSGTVYNNHTITTETYIAVWNPHGHAIKQPVTLDIMLPDGLHPNVLLSPSDDEQPFTWDANSKQINFIADVAAAGYAVYTLQVSNEKTADYNQRRAVAGRSIGAVAGESLGLVGGRLDWTFANGNIIDLLTYHDGGDAGDIWQYHEPDPDVLMKGSIVDVIQVEATPTYERLIFRNRMRIAPRLKDGKERVRGLRVLDLNTIATYHNGVKGIHFRTNFTNTAEDHRLRVHLRTGIQTDYIYTDAAYSLTKRAIATDNPTGDLPVQSTIMLTGDERGLAIFTRGLLAVEPIREDNQITLALTLLRAVGYLDKAANVKSDGAQMPDDFVTEFMLLPLDSNPDEGELVRRSLAYSAPLQTLQYAEKPAIPRQSFVAIDSNQVVITSIKPPQNQKGLIIRLRNTALEEVDATLTTQQIIRVAREVTLAEVPVRDLAARDKTLTVTVPAGQIMTVLLQF